jgi:RNA polymerase sigma factor (sigma-70 family)
MVRTDIELWASAADGDGDAFAVLFRRYANPIYNFCFRRTADWTLAEDLTSRTFLEAWRRRAEVRLFGDSLLPWLYGVAANVVRAESRSRRRRRDAYARIPLPLDALDVADEVAERLDDERTMQRIVDALKELGEIDRDVLVLAWQRMSYAEIAHALDLPVGTVRSRLSRARARLRVVVTDSDQDDDYSGHVATAIGDDNGRN